jgi:hypothetical protein
VLAARVLPRLHLLVSMGLSEADACACVERCIKGGLGMMLHMGLGESYLFGF